MLMGEQIRAARGLLNWSAKTLSEKSGVSYPTVQRLESKNGPIGGLAKTSAKISAAIEAAGVEFINSDAPGVRLKPKE